MLLHGSVLHHLLMAFWLLLCWVQPAHGQESADTTRPARPEPPEEAQQFNFWLGEWDVVDSSGKHVGTNVISSVLDGFGVMEQWAGDGGMVGMSLNSYDRVQKRWQQTWVDNTGGILRLDGGLTGGSMVLSGVRKAGKGTEITDRIIWTPLESGDVRQVWEISSDGGGSWAVIFDGTYKKK